ncbi:MAG: Mbeg1-like protein [Sphaerochaetaceae bacterium]|jgi:pimeloyl-ACP methyl ester carboxylesterase
MKKKETEIFDYLLWRGDLSFESSPLCEVDYLVFSRMAYLPFEMHECRGRTLKDAIGMFTEDDRFLMQQDRPLAAALASSRRFSGIEVVDFHKIFSKESEEQFCAILFRLDPETLLFDFRGTDSTIVGWKEDFNMGFKTPVPSQNDALEFVEDEAHRHPDDKLVFCGHSKGGNLAEYCALLCSKSIQDRILMVADHDGPGFEENSIGSSLYEPLKGRYQFFVPQSSVIGMLLRHWIAPEVIRSTNTGIMQHDIYSWQLSGPRLERVDARTVSSRLFDQTLHSWLVSLSEDERQKFVDELFAAFLSYGSDGVTFHQFRKDWKKSIPLLIDQIKGMDSQTKKMMGRLLGQFFLCAGEALPDVRLEEEQRL